jgi:hypothetical protein
MFYFNLEVENITLILAWYLRHFSAKLGTEKITEENKIISKCESSITRTNKGQDENVNIQRRNETVAALMYRAVRSRREAQLRTIVGMELCLS